MPKKTHAPSASFRSAIEPRGGKENAKLPEALMGAVMDDVVVCTPLAPL